MPLTNDLFPTVAKVLSVAELTRAIRGTLETKFGAVWVQGEISNYKLHPSGHQYFTLKDQRAAISCVIFRSAMISNQALADGAQVQLYGNISVFEARGQYQLSVQIVQTRGAGLLQAKFEALKRKLEAEGLFDSARKRALPKFPRRIGIITSPSGAAIRDILNVLQRRAPHVQLLISPVRVQGAGAAAEIAVALRELSRPNESWPALDLIVIARGGGSIEDLWEFNEEIVARAIFDSPIPIVSAVGHEIDFTIADFVADLRAPTPSAAAELIVADSTEMQRRIAEFGIYLDRFVKNYLAQSQTQLRLWSERTLGRELLTRLRETQQQLDLTRGSMRSEVEAHLKNARANLLLRQQTLRTFDPSRELETRRQALKNLRRRFELLPARSLENARKNFERIATLLRALGPEATLARGYSITTDASGEVIRSKQLVRPKMKIRTRVSDGEFESTVSGPNTP